MNVPNSPARTPQLERKPYAPPTVARLGEIVERTLGNGSTAVEPNGYMPALVVTNAPSSSRL